MKSRIVNVGNTESPSSQNSKHNTVVYPVVERNGFDCVMRVREIDAWQPNSENSIQESDDNESVTNTIAEIMKRNCSHVQLKDEMRWGRFVDEEMERMYRDYYAAKNWHSVIRLLYISSVYYFFHIFSFISRRGFSNPVPLSLLMAGLFANIWGIIVLNVRAREGSIFFRTHTCVFGILVLTQTGMDFGQEFIYFLNPLYFMVLVGTSVIRGDYLRTMSISLLSLVCTLMKTLFYDDGIFLFCMALQYSYLIVIYGVIFRQLESVDRRAFMKIILMNQADQTAKEEKSKAMKLLYNLFPRPLADKEVAGSSLGQDEITRMHGTVICVEYGTHNQRVTKIHSRKHSESHVMLLELIREIGDRLQIHLINTKGRKFILASGMFENEIEHQQNAHEFAGLLIESMKSYLNSKEKSKDANSQGMIRIGIASGSLAHGILNFNKRRAYDIFGACVNESEVQCQKAQWWRIESKQKRQSRPKLLDLKKFSVPDILRASQARLGRYRPQQTELNEESKGKFEENQKRELDTTPWLQGKTLLQPYRHKFLKIFPYFRFDGQLERDYEVARLNEDIFRETSDIFCLMVFGAILDPAVSFILYRLLELLLDNPIKEILILHYAFFNPVLVLLTMGLHLTKNTLRSQKKSCDVYFYILVLLWLSLFQTISRSALERLLLDTSSLLFNGMIATMSIQFGTSQIYMAALFSLRAIPGKIQIVAFSLGLVTDALFSLFVTSRRSSHAEAYSSYPIISALPYTILFVGLYGRAQIGREEYLLSRKLEKDIKSANEQSEIAQAITTSIIPQGLYMAIQSNSEKILQNLDDVLVIAIAFSKPQNLTIDQSSNALQDIVAFTSECFEFASRVASDYNLSIAKTSGTICLIVVPTSSDKSKSIHAAFRFCLQLESLSCGKENHPEMKAKFVAQICASMGDIVVGIVGKSTFRYDVLGTPVDDVFENVAQGDSHRVQLCDSLVTLVEMDREFRLVHESRDSETHGDEGNASPRLYLEGVSDIWGMFCKYVDWGDNSLHKE